LLKGILIPRGGDDFSINETVKKVQLLFMHSAVQAATAPLLIATAERFGVDSQEFADIVSELENWYSDIP